MGGSEKLGDESRAQGTQEEGGKKKKKIRGWAAQLSAAIS